MEPLGCCWPERLWYCAAWSSAQVGTVGCELELWIADSKLCISVLRGVMLLLRRSNW